MHQKRTSFMVPAGSVYEELLTRRCDGTHEHQHVFGGSAVTKKAGNYTWELVATMLEGATWQRAAESTLLAEAVFEMTTKSSTASSLTELE